MATDKLQSEDRVSRRRFLRTAAAMTGAGVAPLAFPTSRAFAQSQVTPATVEDYLAGLSPWPAPPMPPTYGRLTENPTSSEHEITGGPALSCISTKQTLTANPEKIVLFEPNSETLWPGALIQGKTLLNVGSLRELPIKKRARLPITVTILALNNTDIVDLPSSSTVDSAIAKLISKITDKGDFGSSVSWDQKTTYSSEQAMIELGFSVSHSGLDVSGKHNQTTSQTSSVVTAAFIQKIFTVHIDNPATPAALFSADMTVQDFIDQEKLGRIGRGNTPVMLSSVTYGRILYFSMSYDGSSKELMDAVSASYAGISGSFDNKHQQVLSNTRMTVSSIGTEDVNFEKLLKTGVLHDYFGTPMNIRSSKPISYVFLNIKDLSIASMTDTATYVVTECTPEHVGPELFGRKTEVENNHKNFSNYVIAAAGNTDDKPTRGLRTGQYRGFDGEIIPNLALMQGMTKSSDETKYLRHWADDILIETDRQVRVWRNQYTNDAFMNQGIYAEAVELSGRQKAALQSFRNTLG